MLRRAGTLMAAFMLILTGISGCTSLHPTVDYGPPPPTREQIVGTWVAYSSTNGYRLELFGDGTGTLAESWLPERGVVRRYETGRWELSEYDFSATFLPVHADGEPVFMKALAFPDAMLKVSISLSDSMRVPVADEFTRESRVNELIKLLNSPETGSGK